jgi:hypothetical protein
MSVLALPAQPVDATQALNLSAGISNDKVLRGRSFRTVKLAVNGPLGGLLRQLQADTVEASTAKTKQISAIISPI